MSSNLNHPTGLHLFRPPYTDCEPITLGWSPEPIQPGGSVVWFMAPTSTVYGEMEWVTRRPRSLPFFVVLPEPDDIVALSGMLRHLPDLGPRGVLPRAGRTTIPALRTLLAAPPTALPVAVGDYLEDTRILPDPASRERVERIFAEAAHVGSIEALATRLCQSRRTLGRFFHQRGLPVPSHWLQFARILHVAIQLQNTRTNINRVSARYNFPDGFTMSNAMKRLTGYRPSFVREHLGWEWIVEAWLRNERRGGTEG